MGFKCALQIKGLTIGEPAPGARHRMNLRKAAMEAGYERASRSDTLERARSRRNKYLGFRSGRACADEMEVQAAVTTVTMKDGTTKQRKTRFDAVPGFAVICNPPGEVCRAWDDDTYHRFYRDAWECLSAVGPDIFRDENLTMTAEHYDEGIPPEENGGVIDRHIHWIGYAKGRDGRWRGNEIDAKFFVELNRQFPALMRARGWDMDDLDTTDYERARQEPEYAAQRRAKRKQSGSSVNGYIAQKHKAAIKEAEAAKQAAEEASQQLEQKVAAILRREQEQQELIVLGRRAKAAQLAEGITLQDRSESSPRRRLPTL